MLTLLNSGVAVQQSINDAWFSVNTPDAQERCVGLALAVAGSNLGGLAGSNIFVKSDAPYYHHGFLKILCIYGGSVLVVTLVILYYLYENRKMAKNMNMNATEISMGRNGETTLAGDGPRKLRNQL
jgi:uncharacterized protein YjeT (DUF2065 family)